MWLGRIFLAIVLGTQQAAAFAVFAHFMVGNTLNYGAGDWQNEMNLAKAAGIDAFALNIARNEQANIEITQAFEVAVSLGFKLFFSFDYAGNGSWEKSAVIDLVNKWKGSSAYYKRGSQPLVSTFEGPGAAPDWHDIKASTGCFFVPDWSSLGAKKAIEAGSGVADGLFSWAAWPSGPTDMTTYGDASYMQFIKSAGKSSYMMPVSPWFYTNLPGYEKNWLWRGDDLWFDRWVQVLYLARIQKDFTAPDFAQIISWNDFGESHYIGPVIDKATYALDQGKGNAPFNYVKGVPHGAFRLFLPFLIQLSKTGTATVGTQGVQMWYRNSQMTACSFAGTVGNTATQLQLEYSPAVILQDKVFYSALLGTSATVTVTVGGVSLGATWTDTPPGGVGIYHGSASFQGRTGEVVVTVNGIATVKGAVPIGGCSSQNFNPYAYNANGPSSSASLNINSHVCVGGFGVGNFNNICKFACALGYCPVTACTCSRIGPQPKMPTALLKDGYPTDGNRNYEGLCSFSVNYGYTGKECSTTKPPTTFIPTNSPFFPNTTTGGVGIASKYDSMCKFSCKYGYCPINLCNPTSTGTLIDLPAWSPVVGTLRTTLDLDERLLCKFTMTYGQVNKDLCFEPPPTTTTQPTTTQTPPTPTKPVTTQTPSTPTPTNVFRIYIGSEISGVMSYDALWLSNEENPGCSLGSPVHTSPRLLNPEDDVSQDGGWACDGCSGTDVGNYKITRLEMWDHTDPKKWDLYGITTSHVGYITAYQQPDGTYELVSTLKIGGAFTHQGTCVREPPDAEKFSCCFPTQVTGGTHVLTCTSFLKANVDTMDSTEGQCG